MIKIVSSRLLSYFDLLHDIQKRAVLWFDIRNNSWLKINNFFRNSVRVELNNCCFVRYERN